jgi:hypothetical protein
VAASGSVWHLVYFTFVLMMMRARKTGLVHSHSVLFLSLFFPKEGGSKVRLALTHFMSYW